MDILLIRVISYSLLVYECFGQNNTEFSESDRSETLHNSESKYEREAVNCSHSYSSECFQSNVARVINIVEHGSAQQLMPGVFLTWPPLSKVWSSLSVQNTSNDQMFLGKMDDYLKSVTLRIQLLNPQTLSFLNSGLEKWFSSAQSNEARKKMKDGGMLISMGMIFGGSFAMIALTFLGVLAGKAIMTGALAFLFAAFTGLSALKGDDKATTYEVISRPVVTHGHSHSSEVQYEHAGHGLHGYKRSVDSYFPTEDLQMVFKNFKET